MKSGIVWKLTTALAGLALLGGVGAACGSDEGADGDGRGLLNVFEDDAGAAGRTDGYTTGAEGAAPPVAGGPAESADGDTGGAPGGAVSQQLLDRKQILTATVQIETGDVAQKFEEAGNIALSAGGVVFSSSFGNDGDRQTASLTMRIPNDRYQEALMALRKLGTVKQEQSSGTDVTGEYTDLESRLRNLRATEAQYLTLLTQATNINDILTVQDRINATRAEIEQIQGRLALLDNQTELATITVHLFPPAVSLVDEDGGISNPAEAAERAFEASVEVLERIAIGAVAVVAFSWWLVPLAGLGLFVWRKQRGARQEASATPAPPAP